MLNKEMLLGGASKKNGPVIMTVGKRTMTASTGPSTDVFGFSKADSIGAINVTPYWWINREKARLLSLTATYLSGSSAAWGTFSDIRGEEESSAEPLLEITITANGRTGKITIPTTSSTALMSYANDVFALRSLVGQQVKLAFAPILIQNGRRFCFALLLHHRPDQRCRNPLVVSCFEGGANA